MTKVKPMNITLSPQLSSSSLSVAKSGEILTINGEEFDFGPLPEGASLPPAAVACGFITGDVRRVGGVLHLTLLLPHGAGASEAARFPAPIINPADGALELPA